MVALGFATGLRPSSLRPLRRRGPEAVVLWDQSAVLVRRSHTCRDEVMEATKQKTRYRITLPDDLMAILNACAERFVLSIRSECLDRIVPSGEAHLSRSISEYLRHYHVERNHQGLENELVAGAPRPANTNGRVGRRDRLVGC